MRLPLNCEPVRLQTRSAGMRCRYGPGWSATLLSSCTLFRQAPTTQATVAAPRQPAQPVLQQMLHAGPALVLIASSSPVPVLHWCSTKT